MPGETRLLDPKGMHGSCLSRREGLRPYYERTGDTWESLKGVL